MRDSVFREFEINLIRLSNAIHNFDFKIDSLFFESFEQDFFSEPNYFIQVEIDKTNPIIKLNFDIKGKMTLICDRSLETFVQNFDINKELFIKIGNENIELDENYIQIDFHTEYINLAQYIYEFIILAVPSKKIHPKFGIDEQNDVFSNEELIFTSETKEIEIITDPRWDVLNKLKEKKEEDGTSKTKNLKNKKR